MGRLSWISRVGGTSVITGVSIKEREAGGSEKML